MTIIRMNQLMKGSRYPGVDRTLQPKTCECGQQAMLIFQQGQAIISTCRSRSCKKRGIDQAMERSERGRCWA